MKELVSLVMFLVTSATIPSAAMQAGDSSDCEILRSIARGIEELKSEYLQLTDFTVEKNFDSSHLVIDYSFHTHEPKRTGGWTSGVPSPDEDGIWFYIDIHDSNSTAQIHTQPVTVPICLGDKRVAFLRLEGTRTKSIGADVWKILKRHGARVCVD